MQVPPATGQDWPTPSTPQPNPWLVHLSRGAWLRGHISVFAFGSVLLLAINLLRGSGGIWADTAISAWAVLVMAHGILLMIARLLQELLADEGNGDIRPASEVHWNAPSSWSLPPRARDRRQAQQAAPAPATPTLDPEASAAAAAARDRKPKPARQAPGEPPATAPKPAEGLPTTEQPAESDRVSWQAATDAAWLTPREPTPAPGKREDPKDDEDDFTPLKFD